MNKLLSDHGWQIALFRWEDSTPSYGRPQSTINKAVDECALFIGMLWEKWGQPTGEYSSGFEEEYERALSRRKKGPEPEIWLVLKSIDSDRMKDPGPQLAKVLSFRDKQRSLNEIFYRPIADVNDWKEKLQNWLWSHIFKLKAATVDAVQSRTPTSSPGIASEAPVPQLSSTAGGGSGAPAQLLRLAGSLTEVIESGEMEFPRGEENHLDDFDVARIALLAATWMSQRQTGETLGTHEINLLYKHRRQLAATPHEEDQLFRTIIADTADVAPGWFWFGGITPEDLPERLLWLANHDSSDQIRARAIDLLRLAGIVLPEDLRPILPLTDGSEQVRNKVYKYLGTIGDDSTAESLAKIASQGDGGSKLAANEARLSILLRLRPDDAFADVIQSEQYISDRTTQEIQLIVAKISETVLLKGAESQWEQIQKICITELSRRRLIPNKLAMKLTEDPSVDIREAAYIELAKQGVALDFDTVKKSLASEDSPHKGLGSLGQLMAGTPRVQGDVDAVILAFFGSQDTAAVLEAVDWFSVKGTLAYKSLAIDHYDAVRDVLRPDLKDGFARIKQKSITAIRSKFGDDYAEEAIKTFAKHDDFIRSQFTEAALSGLAANSEPSDIEFGRQYLGNKRQAVKLDAVRIVAKFGTAEDAPSLLGIYRDSYGEVRDEAGMAALRLSPQPFEIARELLQSGHQDLMRACSDWLYAQDSDEVRRFFGGLLDNESATDRERALYFFSRKLDENGLSQLLEAQFLKGTYYYNVITWLDRLLYSPEALRAFFRQVLKRSATPRM